MLSSSVRLLGRQKQHVVARQSVGLSTSDRHRSSAPSGALSFPFSTRSNDPPNSNVTPVKKESVHPLSQLVLEYLQSNRAGWVKDRGLNESLKIQANGTILMRFPNGRVWTTFDHTYKQHWLMVRMNTTENEHGDDKTKTGNSATTELMGRFLLQDNLRPAWNDGHSTPEKVQKAVEEMIEKMETLLDQDRKNAAVAAGEAPKVDQGTEPIAEKKPEEESSKKDEGRDHDDGGPEDKS